MWEPCKTKKERVERIRKLLKENDMAVKRGIVAIYRRQTDEEKCTDATRLHNGIGFSAYDAPFLSSLAKQLLDGKELSPKQMAIGRNKICRYAGQLASIAETREQSNQPV